jgi:hypothetical protein
MGGGVFCLEAGIFSNCCLELGREKTGLIGNKVGESRLESKSNSNGLKYSASPKMEDISESSLYQSCGSIIINISIKISEALDEANFICAKKCVRKRYVREGCAREWYTREWCAREGYVREGYVREGCARETVGFPALPFFALKE